MGGSVPDFRIHNVQRRQGKEIPPAHVHLKLLGPDSSRQVARERVAEVGGLQPQVLGVPQEVGTRLVVPVGPVPVVGPGAGGIGVLRRPAPLGEFVEPVPERRDRAREHVLLDLRCALELEPRVEPPDRGPQVEGADQVRPVVLLDPAPVVGVDIPVAVDVLKPDVPRSGPREDRLGVVDLLLGAVDPVGDEVETGSHWLALVLLPLGNALRLGEEFDLVLRVGQVHPAAERHVRGYVLRVGDLSLEALAVDPTDVLAGEGEAPGARDLLVPEPQNVVPVLPEVGQVKGEPLVENGALQAHVELGGNLPGNVRVRDAGLRDLILELVPERDLTAESERPQELKGLDLVVPDLPEGGAQLQPVEDPAGGVAEPLFLSHSPAGRHRGEEPEPVALGEDVGPVVPGHHLQEIFFLVVVVRAAEEIQARGVPALSVNVLLHRPARKEVVQLRSREEATEGKHVFPALPLVFAPEKQASVVAPKIVLVRGRRPNQGVADRLVPLRETGVGHADLGARENGVAVVVPGSVPVVERPGLLEALVVLELMIVGDRPLRRPSLNPGHVEIQREVALDEVELLVVESGLVRNDRVDALLLGRPRFSRRPERRVDRLSALEHLPGRVLAPCPGGRVPAFQSAVQVEPDRQVVEGLHVDVAANAELVVPGSAVDQDSVLGRPLHRDPVPDRLAPAGDRRGGLQLARKVLEARLVPVRIKALEAARRAVAMLLDRLLRIGGRIPRILLHFVAHLHPRSGVGHLGHDRRLGERSLDVYVNLSLAGRPPLGLHENHAVGRPRPVDGRRRVLQHRHALDVRRVEAREPALPSRHPVDHHERVVVV